MPIPSFLSIALNALARYIDSQRQSFVDAITPVADRGIDAVAAAIKKVADSTFFGRLLDGLIAQYDAEAKAAVPVDAGKLVDFITAEITKLANS